MTKWAILVGVDVVPELGDLPRCRNDVKTLKRLLQRRFGFDNQHMLEMLASHGNHELSEDLATFGGIITKSVPTYANIIEAFRTLESLCCPSDIIYFHLSGVVTSAHSILPEFAAFPNFYTDMAFIPARDCTQHPYQLLRHIELSALIHELTQKAAEVIAMLDCEPLPLDVSVSDLLGHDDIPSATNSSIPLHRLREICFSDTKWRRPLEFPDSWMFDPSPEEALSMITTFDILTGCTRTLSKSKDGWEFVHELEDSSGLCHGMLTHWMVKIFQGLDDNEAVTLRKLYYLMLKQATLDGITQDGNKLRLIGNGLRLFPGSCKNEESRPLLTIPEHSGLATELPRSKNRSVHRCSRQSELLPAGTKSLKCA